MPRHTWFNLIAGLPIGNLICGIEEAIRQVQPLLVVVIGLYELLQSRRYENGNPDCFGSSLLTNVFEEKDVHYRA